MLDELVATMGIWLPKLTEHGEFGDDAHRLTERTRTQPLTVSGATIDRLLKPTRDGMRLTGISGTKAGPLLRTSITVRKAGDEHEQTPAFCEIDLVLHCGPTLKGEFARTLTVTDVHIGWAGERDLFFTRARPDHSNDNAHVEQKNGDVVRRHAFHYRYDTPAELRLLNELYALVRVRLNLFTATTRAIGYRTNRNGKSVRVYDKPRTPYQRVIDSGVLTTAKAAELTALFKNTNPAELTRQITAIQTRLSHLAAAKTTALSAGTSRAKPGEARTHHSRAS